MSEVNHDVASPKQTRLLIHSTPRSTSVILTKCLSRIADSEVFIEPHYWCYEAEQHLKDMGKLEDAQADRLPREDWLKVAELIAGEDCSHGIIDLDLLSFTKMKRALENPNREKSLILSKSMTVGFKGNMEYLPSKSSNYHHIFLLRHPIKVLLSWRKLLYVLVTTVQAPNSAHITSLENFHFIRDCPEKYARLGYLIDELHSVWTHVRENLDSNPIVIDSDDLLSNPAGILSNLCAATGLPYSDALLRWDADPTYTDEWRNLFRPIRCFEMGRASCHNAFYSTEFQPPKALPSMDALPEDVREGVEAVMPYYTEMYERRILP